MPLSTAKRKGRNERDPRRYKFVVSEMMLDVLAEVAKYEEGVRTQRVCEALKWNDAMVRLKLRVLHSYGYTDHANEEGVRSDWGRQTEHIINDKGRDLLKQFGREVVPLMRKAGREPGVKQRGRPHTLMISDCLSNIAGAAGDRFIPADQLFGGKIPALKYDIEHTFKFRHGERTEKISATMRPDAIFGIRYGEGIIFYILECEDTSPVEPTTLDRSSFLRKLLAYYDILITKKLHKELGLYRVKLLITAPTQARLDYKKGKVEKILGDAADMYFQKVPYSGDIPNLFTTPWERVGHDPITLDAGV